MLILATPIVIKALESRSWVPHSLVDWKYRLGVDLKRKSPGKVLGFPSPHSYSALRNQMDSLRDSLSIISSVLSFLEGNAENRR